ncbi:MAG: PucR family transcriptional regulator ligand-binding domain-containing protein [Clostridiaceae bacterium]|nr:PucR family transcriptional regulator ligand-binding domain-containing protein [Clostridiaceae bacterium]
MSITVAEALSIGGMRKCSLIAGKSGLEREIRCIDTMEEPNIYRWLQKHELLMTTGYSIRDDNHLFLELIDQLNRAGGAGLAIATHFIGEFSADAIALADRLGLPLIKIPPNIPFIELTNPLMKAIVDNQNKVLRFSESMNKQFIDLQINGGGFQDIVNVLGKLTDYTVFITDPHFKVLACSGINHEDLLVSLLTKSGENGSYIRPEVLGDKNSRGQKPAVLPHLDDIQLMAQEVLVRKSLSGYIIVAFKGKKNDEYKDIALHHAAMSAALEFSKLKTAENSKLLLDNSLFMDLVLGNVAAERDAADRASALGWPVLPASLAMLNIEKLATDKQGKSEDDIQTIRETLAAVVKNTLLEHQIKCTAAVNQDAIMIIFADSYEKDHILEGFQTVITQVREQTGYPAKAYISLSLSAYTELAQAYKECLNAIVAVKTTAVNDPIIFVQNIMLEIALMNINAQPFFQKYVHILMDDLQVFDNNNQAGLLVTLEALIDNMGVRSAAAKQLFLHRNTLAYRIKKIESLTGCNLENGRDLLTFGLAAKLLRYT